RPTDTSISIKIVPDSDIQYYYEYGTSPGSYTAGQTATISAEGGEPSTATMTGLSPNTHYYYRMQYNYNSTGWVVRPEHSFWTQRNNGATFDFTITSDSHVGIMLGSASTWTQTMTNVAADQPDFHIDLGDTFAMDSVTSLSVADANYLEQRDYFDLVGHSAGIYLAMGNHEQTEGWHLDDSSNINTSPPVMSTNMMKKYYLNPAPNSFYSGNTVTYSYIDGDGLLEDYFAWEWGDALFVFIDPFWNTTSKPYAGNTGGGEPETGTGDRWDWTLGQDQYDWLKQTLENSHASYKFIFAHHMVGGSDDYVRGGANPAHLVEWGGYNEAGTTYEWESRRSGWGSETIHDILVANQVSAFIHGHDHQYAYEARDGVVYLSMPAAGFSGSGFNIYSTGSGYTIQALPSPGHVRVHVTPSVATFDYIATSGGTVNYSFDIEPSEAPEGMLGDVNGSGGVDSTDALIVLSADAGINVTSFCPMNCGDVNRDGLVNSTDALILLSFDAGLGVSFDIGLPGCPLTITQPSGCSAP
ncbi:MAG: hypothetical protein GX577_15015, partial [Leptolinea sp.]|nr:hypothetical protein [Leptolinea sp.]